MQLVFVYKIELTTPFITSMYDWTADGLMIARRYRGNVSDFVDDYELTFVQNLQTKL